MKYGGARRAVNACGTTDKLAGQLITLTSELDAEINSLHSQRLARPPRGAPAAPPLTHACHSLLRGVVRVVDG